MDKEVTHPSAGKLKWVEHTSYLLDNQFRIPGTNFRFGIDPLLNLIPIAGNVPGFLMSAVLLITIASHGVSRKVIILMTINILLDATIGAVPILGNIFDFFFKANARNVNLLRKHYQEGKYQGSGRGIIIALLILLIIFLIFLFYIVAKLFGWLFNQF